MLAGRSNKPPRGPQEVSHNLGFIHCPRTAYPTWSPLAGPARAFRLNVAGFAATWIGKPSCDLAAIPQAAAATAEMAGVEQASSGGRAVQAAVEVAGQST
eukprot:9495969-Pyramimonas_sp.AAC.1